MDKIGIYLIDDKCLPERHGDWIDLKSSTDIHLKKGDAVYIPLGVSIAIPEGKEAHLLPRSSTFAKFKIIQTNSTGIIDNAYGEEWMMPVLATADTFIPAYTRIAQFRVFDNMKTVEMYLTDMLEEGKTRSGFGSTDDLRADAEFENLVRDFLKKQQ